MASLREDIPLPDEVDNDEPSRTLISSRWDGRDGVGCPLLDGIYPNSGQALLLEKDDGEIEVRPAQIAFPGSIVLDCIPPEIGISSPHDGFLTDQAELTVVGAITDSVGLATMG